MASTDSPQLSTLSGNRVAESTLEIFKDDPLWEEYVKKATEFDKRMIDEWNKIVDVILVYVALITSVLTSFIVKTSTRFKRDPGDISNDLLVAIYNQLAAQSNNITIPLINTTSIFEQKKPDYYAAVLINSLLYSSLALCTVVSVIALGAKMWLVSYCHRAFSDGTPYDRAMKRQGAYSGVLAWKLGGVINSLPLVLLIALIMFAFFIHTSLWDDQHNVGYAVGTVIGVGLMAFGVTALFAAFVPACPFHSSFSTAIQSAFILPEKLSIRILISLCAGKLSESSSIIRWLRIGTYTFLGFGSAAGVLYATWHSSNFTTLTCIPIAITFAYSLQEEPEKTYKPQKQRLPLLAVLMFLIIAPMLSIAGYRNQHHVMFLSLYGFVMLFLVIFGCITSRMSKSMKETGEVDAIAWLLRSTSSQNPIFFESATRIACSSNGHHYKPRLLELLMPLLSPLITSYRTDKDEKGQEELQIYVSCLAQLSDFEDHEGSFWCLMEDAKRHPQLEESLCDKLKELANDPQYSPNLRKTAIKALKFNGQSRNSMDIFIGDTHSPEEMAIRSRRKNGYFVVGL